MDIDFLLALQQFRESTGSFLTEFFAKMTFFGELPTVMIIMAVVYWCLSKEFGSYLLMGWSGNRLVNGFLKVTACAYRPWIRDARIVPYGNAMTTATGYSFPSGHSMNGSTVYGGCIVRKDIPKGFRIVMGFLIVLIGLSRCWLGVHTPQDILVGWVCGLLVMWLVAKLMRWIEAHPEKDFLVACIGILLAAIVAVYASVKSYPVDYNAEGKILVDGTKMANDTFKGVGWCLAFLVGWILERRFVRFTTNVSSQRKLVRLGSGLLSYYAVSLILVPLVKNWIGGPAGTLISCFLQIFYITFLFPWIFKHFEKEK